MRPTRQGSIPPPGGAVQIEDHVRERLPEPELHPPVRAQLQIGEEPVPAVEHERGM